MSKENIITLVQEFMMTDDEPESKQNAIIYKKYSTSRPEVQAHIDDIFIALCGWSLKSIIEVL